MSAEQFHQILKFGRERGRWSLVQSAPLSTKLRRPLSLPNFKIWWNCSADMNRNVKDYLILKGDFDFAIPWITLPLGSRVTQGEMKNISFTPLLSRVWGQHTYQKKQNLLQNLNSLVWCAVFQSKLSKLQKTLKISQKRWKTAIFQWFFEVCSILAEKQRTKPKILSFLKNFASFGTNVVPKLAIIVELF